MTTTYVDLETLAKGHAPGNAPGDATGARHVFDAIASRRCAASSAVGGASAGSQAGTGEGRSATSSRYPPTRSSSLCSGAICRASWRCSSSALVGGECLSETDSFRAARSWRASQPCGLRLRERGGAIEGSSRWSPASNPADDDLSAATPDGEPSRLEI